MLCNKAIIDQTELQKMVLVQLPAVQFATQANAGHQVTLHLTESQQLDQKHSCSAYIGHFNEET